jgi:lethal(2) giant larvae protein
MDAVLRRLKLKKGEPHEPEARKSLQRELFSLDKCIEQGFPYKSSALAYDPKLSLLAISTKSGVLTIYGQPGVLFSGQHKDDVGIVRILMLPEQGRLITIGADSSLHRWQINATKDGHSSLDEVSTSFVVDGSKPKTIASCCLSKSADRLYVGTDEGCLHVLDVLSFKRIGDVVSQERMTQSVQPEYQHNPGAVESIVQHPTADDMVLVGFDRGIIILWDVVAGSPTHSYVSLQQLESVSFSRNGREFVSCHSDGSYIIWTTDEPNFPKEAATTPYGMQDRQRLLSLLL